MRFYRLIFGLVLASCSHATQTTTSQVATEPADVVLERGGDLLDAAAETVVLTETAIVAWGILEVPAEARLETAYAGAEVVARSELLKFIEAHVTSSALDRQSSTSLTIQLDSAEAVRRSQSGIVITGRGWQKVKVAQTLILRVIARAELKRVHIEK